MNKCDGFRVSCDKVPCNEYHSKANICIPVVLPRCKVLNNYTPIFLILRSEAKFLLYIRNVLIIKTVNVTSIFKPGCESN